MDISLDYRDLFRILNRHKVKYLIVGAYAVVYYTEPRFTKDLDLWVKADIKNAEKLYKALKQFGAPLRDIRLKDFTNERMVYQIGIAPIRVDIIMGLPGISFDLAWKNRVRSKYEDTQINIIGIKDLIKSKKKANRPHDRLDLNRLTAKKRAGNKSAFTS
ncbi:MAG: hypothetical protein KKC66_05415 [Candidatus Omnitrophica bacterium]|nr:hypothetical protein [Candidatus Omnitrophota bacterium]MBU1933319.1 hypothetical protein [Candidatus Omnitrophota bacterium]